MTGYRRHQVLASKESRWFWLILPFYFSAVACGSAPVYEGKGAVQGATAQPTGNQGKTASPTANAPATTPATGAKSSPVTATGKSPAPAATPAPGTKLAIRTAASASEKTTMQALYSSAAAQGGCMDCHGALAASAKKGRTAAQIQGAASILQHATPAAARKWPTDKLDVNDDGVDTAVLSASAMAEILK